MKSVIRTWLERILSLLFCASILVALLTRVICIRDTKDFDRLQPELIAPDVIAAVFYEESLDQLYVCYNDASYVNVYSGDGSFRWAVSAPYLRNVNFLVEDGKLILSGGKSYHYDAADGTFLGIGDPLEVYGDEEIPVGGGYSYDAFQVYLEHSDGRFDTIISRPLWYNLTYFPYCWLIGFACGLAYFAMEYFERFVRWLSLRKKVRIKGVKAKACLVYMQMKCIVQTLFAVADVILAARRVDISFYAFFLGIHFVLTGIIIFNVLASVEADENQAKVLSFWKASDFVTFFGAFVSVIIANVLLGNF